MKKIRRIIIIISLLLVLLAAFALTGCAEHIEDTNGADTAICTITKEQIEAEKPEHRKISAQL